MTVDFFITKADIRVSILYSTLIGHNYTINSIKLYDIETCTRKPCQKFSQRQTFCIIQELLLWVLLSKLFTLFLFSTKAGISPQTFWLILFLVCLLYHHPKSMWLAQHNPLQKINIAIHIHVFVLIFYM